MSKKGCKHEWKLEPELGFIYYPSDNAVGYTYEAKLVCLRCMSYKTVFINEIENE